MATEGLEAADQAHARALGVAERAHGVDHPEVALALERIGTTEYRAGHCEAARPRLERALEIRRLALGETHSLTAWTYFDLACIDACLDDRDGALTSLRTMVNVGFTQYEWLERARCFEALRDDPEFMAIVAAAHENAERRQGSQ
jgi:hypothetical protein